VRFSSRHRYLVAIVASERLVGARRDRVVGRNLPRRFEPLRHQPREVSGQFARPVKLDKPLQDFLPACCRHVWPDVPGPKPSGTTPEPQRRRCFKVFDHREA
jgi:hypothetical protein